MFNQKLDLKEKITSTVQEKESHPKETSIIGNEYLKNQMYTELIQNSHAAGATKASLEMGINRITYSDNRPSQRNTFVESKGIFSFKYSQDAIEELILGNAKIFSIAREATLFIESENGFRTKIELNEAGSLSVKKVAATGNQGMELTILTHDTHYASTVGLYSYLISSYYIKDMEFSFDGSKIEAKNPALRAAKTEAFHEKIVFSLTDPNYGIYRDYTVYLHPETTEVVVVEQGIKLASYKAPMGAVIVFDKFNSCEKHDEYGIFGTPYWTNHEINNVYGKWIKELSDQKRA